MDPMIEEFCRAHELRVEVFRRMQRYFRDVVAPQLAKVEPLELENEKLREELSTLRDFIANGSSGIGAIQGVIKRKRGRPRKYPLTEVPA